jgi:hypothetical protein
VKRASIFSLFNPRGDLGQNRMTASIISITSRRKRHYARMADLHVISANGLSDRQ